VSSGTLTKVLAVILLAAIAVPAVALGLAMSPLFFLLLLLMVFVPLLFLRPTQPETRRRR
jgi:hypothetical protein